jgi:hypothetical protein
MKNMLVDQIKRRHLTLPVLSMVALMLLSLGASGVEAQSPGSVTCFNLEARAGEGPRHVLQICRANGCFFTREIPGGCPVN